MDEGEDGDESDNEPKTFIADSIMGAGQSNNGSADILAEVKQIRDTKGRFVETNGAGRYNRKHKKGKNCQYSRYVWEQANGLIPKGCMIHHKNGNKKDDRIENLQMMTYKEHNMLHGKGRIPWNKNKKCPQISKSKLGHIVTPTQIKKQKETWKNKYIISMEKIHRLKNSGISYKEIGKTMNITENCAMHRHRKYLKDYY